MTNPVLFLDLDGPLFDYRQIHFHPMNSEPYPGEIGRRNEHFSKMATYWKMNESAVSILNKANKYIPFDVVMSTTWVNFTPQNVMQELFYINELDLNFHEDWATPRRLTSYRVNEINWWLEEHPEVKHFMILDDPDSGVGLDRFSTFPNSERNHLLMLVDPELGITRSDYASMLTFLESTT